MPVIASFYGMVIRVYHADHPPAHIHVQYGEMSAIVEIQTGDVLHGALPKRLAGLLREWLKKYRGEILRAWEDAQAHRAPKRVKPME